MGGRGGGGAGGRGAVAKLQMVGALGVRPALWAIPGPCSYGGGEG